MNIRESGTCTVDLSEEDIISAMKALKGYIDITPGDFREIYEIAYRHAIEHFGKTITANDLMTRDVISVVPATPLMEVAELLNVSRITGLPVIDNERKVLGIISEKDFIFHMGGQKEKTFMGVVARCLRGSGCIAISMRMQTAKDIMTSPVISISENTLVSEIASIFTQNSINRVPVTDNINRVMGIVTRTDIVQSSCSIKI